MIYTLGMCTNYLGSTGDVAAKLGRIAAAGFTHVLWGEHAWHDYMYTDAEIEYAAKCLERAGLRVSDLHAPIGKDQCWGSAVEHQRLAGIEAVKNRLRMAAAIGCDVVVLHTPEEPAAAERTVYWDRQKRTLDALRETSAACRVRLALENVMPGNFDTLDGFLALGGPEFLGICYDSGHGNAAAGPRGWALERLERIKDRLVDMHLHDNDGVGDLHALPFGGTSDWQRLATIVATSGYLRRVVPLEVSMERAGFADEAAFLARAALMAGRLAAMFEAAADGAGR